MENSTQADVVIIGAGISGLGVALALRSSGLNVCLIEKSSKACSETSNNTFRIMHGGFRYLQKLDFPRIFESIRDQKFLLERFPETVKPFDCLMPLNKFGLKSFLPLYFASKFYNLLCLFFTGKWGQAKVVSSASAKNLNPLFNPKVHKYGALLWQDGRLFSNEKLVSAIISSFDLSQVRLELEAEVIAVNRSADKYEVQYKSAHGVHKIIAPVVVNTAGPWLGLTDKFSSKLFPNLKLARSFNLVLRKQMNSDAGFGLESREGRLYFVVPRYDEAHGKHLAIGTFNVIPAVGAEFAKVDNSQIKQAIEDFNSLNLELQVTLDDIISVEEGALPIAGVSAGVPRFYGQEQIRSKGGYIAVMSTKYTTFRSQGEKVASIVKNYLKTRP